MISKENYASTNAPAKAERDSSFELLRIIAMFCIVLCHFATHGGFEFDPQTLSLSRVWWLLIEMGGNVGVNVFVLISGYFLIGSQSGLFNGRRILRFWRQVFFYSVILYVIFAIAGVIDFSPKAFVKTLFPILFEEWWFASTIFVLYLVHPFLNIFLNRLDKKTYRCLLTLLIGIWCIIPTFTEVSYQSNNFLWFVTLYCIAGYIRLFGLNPKFGVKHHLWFLLLFSALRYASSIVLIVLGKKFPSFADEPLMFYETQSVLTLACAVSLFMIFKTVRMGHHKWINVLASATFGVYLIHDSTLVRPFLWETVFRNAAYQDSALLIPYSIGVVCLVYAVCTLIDLFRQMTFEKVFLFLLNKYADVLVKPFRKLVAFCQKTVFGESKA